MKIAADCTRPKPLPGPVDLIPILVCIILWPTFLQAEDVEAQSHIISSPPVIPNEISDPVSTRLSGNDRSRLMAAKQDHSERKSPLEDESRDKSVFFLIGIGINIILALVFSWWFTREWRKTGNSRRSENVD
ncbi:MAG TPA: hypothetical protein VIU36_06420 [Gammaproteobacteria bacterium]|jgi:hypothetical protein